MAWVIASIILIYLGVTLLHQAEPARAVLPLNQADRSRQHLLRLCGWLGLALALSVAVLGAGIARGIPTFLVLLMGFGLLPIFLLSGRKSFVAGSVVSTLVGLVFAVMIAAGGT